MVSEGMSVVRSGTLHYKPLATFYVACPDGCKRMMPVTWGYAVFFSSFLHQLQLPSHSLAAIQKMKIPNSGLNVFAIMKKFMVTVLRAGTF